MQTSTFLTTEQLSLRIHYDARTIRDQLKDNVLIEGVHYVRPFGRRKLLFIWETIERDILKKAVETSFGIPMANGGVCHG